MSTELVFFNTEVKNRNEIFNLVHNNVHYFWTAIFHNSSYTLILYSNLTINTLSTHVSLNWGPKCHETNYIAIFIFILNPLLFHKHYSFLLCKMQTKSDFWFKFHRKIIQISLCLSFYNIDIFCIRYENFTLINVFSFPIIESYIFCKSFSEKNIQFSTL